MTGTYFSLNGKLLPVSEALVTWDDFPVTYGMGVYETLKVRHGKMFFAPHHEERLLHSANEVGIAHPWVTGEIGPTEFLKYLDSKLYFPCKKT